MNKRIYLSSPTMYGEEQAYIKEAFDTNWVAPLGPNVDAFEREMEAYTKAPHAAALSAGTAAIHLAVKLLGIGEGDVVFCPTLTFSATCNPVVYEKATPVFIDAEEETWNMSPEALRRAFEKYPSPKAVIIVHLYGTPAKVDELMDICAAHHVPVIEDAAESLGALYRGRETGTFGKFGIYSFNGNKIITTSGGGMLVSDDEEAIKKARFLATQARDPARHYQHSEIGYNYRMSNIVAGIGRGQLLHLDEHIAKKKAIRKRYEEAFADIPEIALNPVHTNEKEKTEANYWLTCMTFTRDAVFSGSITPDRIMDALAEENIESRPIWKPLHLQPVFRECDFITTTNEEAKGASRIEDGKAANRTYSVSEDIFLRGLCLPSDIKNTPEDMELIISTVRRVL